ncbi:hypothetical protein L1F30_01860 [Simiduia sp. 21SJ11W-1]|uniref:glycoside hydrolase family 38 N-terminal domain-containing protein n=1 Tax=Simiduia sp. 21SJ11W-1 TaxID=2909669 RepID=UPI0020A0476A|nr:glycoside hydrolase family 38 C-terminal domain-containing protein [Simiduia sp. 21SJ11W-1]UTA48300.1 hypothetical protein L1F30_01860 [Simiduia sp. 21SJ11W-1]
MSYQEVAVVVQTHWDREWYFAHQTFLARLLRVMGQVVDQLDSGDLHSFLFDGQVSAIEDFYQQAEPALAARVRAHVEAGRIVIGPWYIMADEFLCAGESLVRNLELGIARANALGRAQKVGYLPDTFGHISQMPQLLQGFGIDNAVAWRGIDSPQSQVQWQGADGSEVFMVFLTEGYYQHPFNTEDWRAALNSYLNKVGPRAKGQPLLLTQGGDHLLTANGLAEKIAAFNGEQSEYRLVQSSLESYIGKLQAEPSHLPTVRGELRDNRTAFVLPDVLSTRQYLKRLNQAIEDRLLGEIEPLLAVAALSDASFEYPARYLELTWQLLIEQHAHDSICGCSVDEVHSEMETRFTQLAQRLDALKAQACLALGMSGDQQARARAQLAPSPFADDAKVSLFNPSAKARSGWQVHEVFVQGMPLNNLQLRTLEGKALACVVLDVAPAEEFHSPVDDFPDMLAGHRYRVAVKADLAGLAVSACALQGDQVETLESTGPQGFNQAHGRAQAAVENSHYRIAVTDGQLEITHKARGQTFANALAIVSELDGGDTYNFSPVGDSRFVATLTEATAWEVNCPDARAPASIQELHLEFSLRQPAGLDDERKPRTDFVTSSGQMRLRLLPESTQIDAQLTWHNRACDQRLRLEIALGQEVQEIAADSAFDWVKRPKVYHCNKQVSGQQESPVAVMPSQSAAQAGPVAFIHRGLQELSLVPGNNQDYFSATLLRSVGWLSRRDLVTRGLGAGPDLATPGAQCLGEHGFAFALAFDAPQAATLLDRADAWRRPVVAVRGHVKAAGLPELTLTEQALQISSLRRITWQGEQALSVRLWNPTEQPLQAEFNQAPCARISLGGETVALSPTVGARQIATFAFSGGALHA